MVCPHNSKIMNSFFDFTRSEVAQKVGKSSLASDLFKSVYLNHATDAAPFLIPDKGPSTKRDAASWVGGLSERKRCVPYRFSLGVRHGVGGGELVRLARGELLVRTTRTR